MINQHSAAVAEWSNSHFCWHTLKLI